MSISSQANIEDKAKEVIKRYSSRELEEIMRRGLKWMFTRYGEYILAGANVYCLECHQVTKSILYHLRCIDEKLWIWSEPPKNRRLKSYGYSRPLKLNGIIKPAVIIPLYRKTVVEKDRVLWRGLRHIGCGGLLEAHITIDGFYVICRRCRRIWSSQIDEHLLIGYTYLKCYE